MSATLDLSHEPVTGVYHGKIGMWLFLASEIMFFSGFFAAFIILRNANLETFMHGAHELNWMLATFNTAVLIGSSLTMALSILNLERGDTAKFRTFLFITILCGFTFLVVKYFEYTAKFHHGITPGTNSFFGLYFLMTGFHGMHVVGGIIPMLWMLLRSFTKDGYSNVHRVEILGLYWHFVDLVWIFLFPVMYLIFPTKG
jgi:cytochrome c oxidase subunit III